MDSLHLLEALGEISEEHIEAARRFRPASRRIFRFSAVAAACLLLCMFSLAALTAADVAAAHTLLYSLSPAVAQQLKPVNLSCEDNGIRLEVLSAQLEGSQALIHISLQDLTGSRIDESVDLFDSYSLRIPSACEGTCTQTGFDPATRTATFLIRLTFEKPLPQGKVTFRLTEFLSGKSDFDGTISQIDLAQIPSVPRRIPLSDEQIRGYGAFGRDNPYLYPHWDGYGLTPDMSGFSPVPGVRITAMGIVDNMLVLQTHYDNITETDNHGSLYLTDSSGRVIESEASLSYWDETQTGSFCEQVFAADTSRLSQYTLHGFFTTCDTITRGNWEITIPLS